MANFFTLLHMAFSETQLEFGTDSRFCGENVVINHCLLEEKTWYIF